MATFEQYEFGPGATWHIGGEEATEERRGPSRDELLKIANETINGDRQRAYGDAKASFTRIADYWSTFLSSKLDTKVVLEPHDIALLLILLKVSRTSTSPTKADNWVDIIGYAALGGEIVR